MATSSETLQPRPRRSPHRFSPMREVRFRCFTSAVVVLSPAARRWDSARGGSCCLCPQVTTGAWSSWASRVLSGASTWTRPTSREITPLECRFKRQTSKKVPGGPLWGALWGPLMAHFPPSLVQRPRLAATEADDIRPQGLHEF